MSKVCRNCQAEISWDIKKREELGYRGPLNRNDLSPHRCYSAAFDKIPNIEESVPPRPPMTDTQVASLPQSDASVIIMALTSLTDSIKLLTLAHLASTDSEREDIRKQVMKQ